MVNAAKNSFDSLRVVWLFRVFFLVLTSIWLADISSWNTWSVSREARECFYFDKDRGLPNSGSWFTSPNITRKPSGRHGQCNVGQALCMIRDFFFSQAAKDSGNRFDLFQLEDVQRHWPVPIRGSGKTIQNPPSAQKRSQILIFVQQSFAVRCCPIKKTRGFVKLWIMHCSLSLFATRFLLGVWCELLWW